MQTLVQVVCSQGRSLRQAIAADQKLEDFRLIVKEQKRKGRLHGWTKVRSVDSDRHGAINVEWDGNTSVLLCRVVTRGKGQPSPIIGDFIDYLLRRFSKRVIAVNIIPP